MAPRSRRPHSRVRRTERVGLTFTPAESGRVGEAAWRNGMAKAAWAAMAVLDRADGRDVAPGGGRVSPEALAALMALSREMAAIGSSLNRAVGALTATGQCPGHLVGYAARCMDAVDRAGDAIEELRPPRHW